MNLGSGVLIFSAIFISDLQLESQGESFILDVSRTGLPNRTEVQTIFGEQPKIKRQATITCNETQWRCYNGECIDSGNRCDGSIDCSDGSDDSFATCRNFKCLKPHFQCAYGGCVDKNIECNGISDCPDSSDELLPECFPAKKRERCKDEGFLCDDGTCVGFDAKCDGHVDCPDSSDETVTLCAATKCRTNFFKCAYGACIDADGKCNDMQDCADNSDEDPELCGTGVAILRPSFASGLLTRRPSDSSCMLPPYPRGGIYNATSGGSFAKPGYWVNELTILTYSCNTDYSLSGIISPYCKAGNWTDTPQCLKMCDLQVSLTVRDFCTKDGVTVHCSAKLESGTKVRSVCEQNHKNKDRLKERTCKDGVWDNPPQRCEPDCGLEKPLGQTLVLKGKEAKRGEFPWHLGVYEYTPKSDSPMQICGATILSRKVAISAAHCFWNVKANKLFSHLLYAVAAGKLYRDYDNDEDKKYSYVQFSDLDNIIVPEAYYGTEQQQQSDLALLILARPLEFSASVIPICMELYDTDFDTKQTSAGSIGKAAGWGVTVEGGDSSPILKTVKLPVVDFNECRDKMPSEWRRFLTSDKFCAGYLNGTGVCSGDSGGGLVFKAHTNYRELWYLRGIVSVGVHSNTSTTCSANAYSGFTRIFIHEALITKTIKETNS